MTETLSIETLERVARELHAALKGAYAVRSVDRGHVLACPDVDEALRARDALGQLLHAAEGPEGAFKPGMQVLYIPRHANGDPRHPDCEHGIVTSVNQTYVFVRYWRMNGSMGPELSSYPAATDPKDLVIFWTAK